MALRDADYYSEHGLNQRNLIMIAQRENARTIREALEQKHDALIGPKQIRVIIRIVQSKTSKTLG